LESVGSKLKSFEDECGCLCPVGPKLSTEGDASISSRGEEKAGEGTFICRICEKSISIDILKSHTLSCTLQTQLDFYMTRWFGIREELSSFCQQVSEKLQEIQANRCKFDLVL
jgi:hypothetical protein